jgi:diguanylate cyclase (GGDEF)-like protein
LEEAPGWRQPVPAQRSRSVPVRPAAVGIPREFRELERYLLLAFLLLATQLTLALAERVEHNISFAAMRVVVSLVVLLICGTAFGRLHGARKGLVRSAPSASDSITGLPDEQYFWTRLREEHARTRRYYEPFAVAILDINGLAIINRSYGEAIGDAVLAYVAQTLASATRATDVAVRLSDDEFALLLLDCDGNGASAFANRLHSYLNTRPAVLTADERPVTIPIAVSIGIAVVTSHETSSEELVARARQNLAAAKEEKTLHSDRWAI